MKQLTNRSPSQNRAGSLPRRLIQGSSISLLALAASGCAYGEDDQFAWDDELVSQKQQEIVNGTLASAYQEAVEINIRKPSGNGLCSGTLISPRLVLTAGHCVVGNVTRYDVVAPFAGNQSATSTWAVAYDYTETGPFVNTSQNDVAVIVLDGPGINLGSYPYPEISDVTPLSGTDARSIGRMRNGNDAPQLYIGAAAPLSPYNSRYFSSSPAIIQPGDSGGPTIVPGTSPTQVVGVNSGNSSSFQIVARVDVMADWINHFVDPGTPVYAVGDNGSAAPNGIGGFDMLSAKDKATALDYDGDGDDDLFIHRPGSRVAYLVRSNGNGTFSNVVASHNGFAGFDFASGHDKATALDYDGDGDDDLLIYRPGSKVAFVVRSNGNGTFTTVSASFNGLAGFDLASQRDRAISLDYDGDGDDDLLLYRPGSKAAFVIRSNGNGTFTTVQPSLNGLAGFDFASAKDRAISLDYDGDGDDDLFMYRPGSRAAFLARSNGNGTFSNVVASLNGFGGFDFASDNDDAIAMDMDGDGVDDLLFYRAGGGIVWAMRSEGTGGFVREYAAPLGAGGYDYKSTSDHAIPMDYNGDGRTDVFSYRPGKGAAWVTDFAGWDF